MEKWKEIPGFPGNEASTLGRIRTYWYKVRNTSGYGTHRELRNIPRMIPMTIEDNGYLHVNIYCDLDGKRYTRKVHVLVAKTFIPLPNDYDSMDYTVDHIEPGPDGKLNNSVGNLRWMTRADNIRKAYEDGMCNDRIQNQCKEVIVTDTWSGCEGYFPSATEAAIMLGFNVSTVLHAIRKNSLVGGRYIIEYIEGEERLLYEHEDYPMFSRL